MVDVPYIDGTFIVDQLEKALEMALLQVLVVV